MPATWKDVFRYHREEIIDGIEDVNTLVDHLYADSIIIMEMKQEIENKPTPNERIRQLLDVVGTIGDRGYNGLMSKLKKDYHHVYTLLESSKKNGIPKKEEINLELPVQASPKDFSLKEEICHQGDSVLKKVFRKRRLFIIESIEDVNTLLDYLYAAGHLTDQQKQTIENECASNKRIRCLLDTLCTKDDHCLEAMMTAFRDKGYPHIFDQLQRDIIVEKLEMTKIYKGKDSIEETEMPKPEDASLGECGFDYPDGRLLDNKKEDSTDSNTLPEANLPGQETTQKRVTRNQALPPEPETGIDLRIRGGPRRRFRETDKVEDLVRFVSCQENATEKFAIHIPGVPDKILSWDCSGLLLREAGILQSQTIDVVWNPTKSDNAQDTRTRMTEPVIPSDGNRDEKKNNCDDDSEMCYSHTAYSSPGYNCKA